MFVYIAVYAVLTCVCAYCSYSYWNNANMAHAQAENFMRIANERLFEADRIWQKVGRYNNQHKKIDKGTLGKVIPFPNRHLKAVPPEDNGPTNAA